MAQHADEDDDGSDQEFRGYGKNFLQGGVDVTGAVGNADAQSRYDYHAQGRETGIVGYHFTEQQYEIFAAEHIIYDYRFARGRVHVIEMHLGQDGGNNAADDERPDKQYGDIRYFIAYPFNKAKDTSGTVFVLSVFHYCITSPFKI